MGRLLRGILCCAVGILLLASLGCTAPAPTATLTPTLTLVPTDTATPRPSPTLLPSPTIIRTALPTLTPTVDGAPAADNATPLPVDIAEGVPPPFALTLPEGWQQGYSILPVRDGLTQTGVPVAIYSGPVPDLDETTGWIVVLWGFPSISPTGQADLWADGVRFLRGALVDTTCTVGTDLSSYFTVGARSDAVGTYFQAIGCQGEPDTAGWFAGVQEAGGNYVFYTYVDPLANFYPAIPYLQNILDSVTWHDLPTRTPTP